MSTPGIAPPGFSGRRSPGRAWLVAIVLILVAWIIWTDPWPFESPVPAATVAPAWATDPTPIRQPGFSPEIQHAGYTYRCGDCHDLFPSPPETTRTLTQHTNIVLKHGMNTRCLNCHHLTDRNTFVDDYGRSIPYDSPQLLCARCHGLVYRDWQHGVHGRTNGYWDESLGVQERRKCVECHDPHQPPFPPMRPAPPPRTLRMGEPSRPAGDEGMADPLRIRDRGTGEAT